MATRERTDAPASRQISLPARAWAALAVGFVVIVALLALTTVTLISQRQRTVLLNRQIATLLGETTLVLKRAGPALDALPARSSTVASRARSAADLVAQARPLLAQARPLVGTLPNTLSNLDALTSDANQAGVVGGLASLLRQVPAASQLISQTAALETSVQRAHLVSQAVDGLGDLDEVVRLQSRTLQVQEATLRNGRSTRQLTAQGLATAQRTLAVALEVLDVARQTLTHAASIDRKVGPVP